MLLHPHIQITIWSMQGSSSREIIMKRYIALVLSFMLLFGFSACGEEEVSSTASTSSVSSKTQPTESKPDTSSEQSVSSTAAPVVSADTETESKPAEEEKEDAVTIKVATFNIGNGAFVQYDFSRIAHVITSKDIDVVGFQEVDKDSSRSLNLDTLKVLSSLTGYKYYYYSPSCDVPGYGGVCGNGILSKYPINIEEKKDMNTFAYVGRNIQHLELNVQGKTVNFYNTHFTWEEKYVRDSHFAELSDYIKGKKNVIVTGDFNIENISEFDAVTTLKKVNTPQTPFETWTLDDGWPTKCLDNIMYDDSSLKLVSSAMDNVVLSDHRMLYAQFEIK